jgi:hypothetical protein
MQFDASELVRRSPRRFSADTLAERGKGEQSLNQQLQ